MIYEWKSGSMIHINAEKAYSEMSSIDRLTPENVLEYARDESTELHKGFEWNDAKAAEKYRLQQARHLIISIVVRDDDEKKEESTRVFQISSEKAVYQPVKFFIENKDEHLKLIERAKAELYAFEKRYKDIAELEKVFDAINEL